MATEEVKISTGKIIRAISMYAGVRVVETMPC